MIMSKPMKTMAPKAVRQEPIESVPVTDEGLVRPIEARDTTGTKQHMKKNSLVILAVYLVLVLLGLGTGYMLATKSSLGTAMVPKGTPINTSKVVGVQDASTFKDCATGQLAKGGLNGEGTHNLVRPGGPSQTAYLISSVIDLDQYVGMTVKVCGQTLQGKNVSWLMDVGRLEIQGK